MEIKVVEFSSREYSDAVKLRKQVLGGKIDYDIEKKLRVFVAIAAGETVGTAAIQFYPFGLARIRQVAVSPSYQGKNIGNQLIRSLEEFAKEQGYFRIILTSRKTAQIFYRKRGYHRLLLSFKKYGTELLWMGKTLSFTEVATFSRCLPFNKEK